MTILKLFFLGRLNYNMSILAIAIAVRGIGSRVLRGGGVSRSSAILHVEDGTGTDEFPHDNDVASRGGIAESSFLHACLVLPVIFCGTGS